MVVSALLLAGTVYLFTIIPMGFIPSVDTGQLSGQIETLQGLGFEATVAPHQGRDGRRSPNDPNVAGYTANVVRVGRAAERGPEAARRADADARTR